MGSLCSRCVHGQKRKNHRCDLPDFKGGALRFWVCSEFKLFKKKGEKKIERLVQVSVY